jgi:hypothetical protein
MPLKLANFTAPHLAVLNQWADQQENTVQAHTKQLNNLSTFLDRLFKANPDLVKPNDK